MQISSEQVEHILEKTAGLRGEPPRVERLERVESVGELADKYGVEVDDVRRFAERAILDEDDPLRETRVREIEQRLVEGAYDVGPDEVIEMAERRAIADRSRIL